jgi:hypothetical protein
MLVASDGKGVCLDSAMRLLRQKKAATTGGLEIGGIAVFAEDFAEDVTHFAQCHLGSCAPEDRDH